ncbi:uncharacterized protein METZ01_LOCUS381651, partial [marine metagenome]
VINCPRGLVPFFTRHDLVVSNKIQVFVYQIFGDGN